MQRGVVNLADMTGVQIINCRWARWWLDEEYKAWAKSQEALRPSYHHEVADRLVEQWWQGWSFKQPHWLPLAEENRWMDGCQVSRVSFRTMTPPRKQTQVNTGRQWKTPDAHSEKKTSWLSHFNNLYAQAFCTGWSLAAVLVVWLQTRTVICTFQFYSQNIFSVLSLN